MTGFGRGSAASDHGQVNLELSAVNRKQADVVIQGIRDFPELENRLRKLATHRISRGRLQIGIQITRPVEKAAGIKLDSSLAKQFNEAFIHLSQELGREILPSAADFLKAPGILSMEDQSMSSQAVWDLIESALEKAFTQFLDMRAQEGAQLANDLKSRLSALRKFRDEIASLAPERPSRYRDLLFKRLVDLGLELDLADERVQREIALFADRCDISEEITRLDAHFLAFESYFTSDEPVGRTLDFLCQELNREFNTIGSKASDAEIAQRVVQAKTELEKIREQVQNIE